MGIRIRLTMNPGLSRERHTVFPKCSDSALAVLNTCPPATATDTHGHSEAAEGNRMTVQLSDHGDLGKK